jgi:transporter family protein
MWILYAIGSSFFAGITAVLAKCGIQKTNSNVATAIRTIVVLLFSWLMVFATGQQKGVCTIEKKELLFICLSGLATGLSWPCHYIS